MAQHSTESMERGTGEPEQRVNEALAGRYGLVGAAAGLAVTTVVQSLAEAQVPPEACDELRANLEEVCPTPKECTLPPGAVLDENTIEITVPESRELIVLEEADPLAEVVVRVSDDVRQSSRAVLVAIRGDPCC